MRGRLHRWKDRAGVSRDLSGQNGIVNEMKANRPMQALVVFIESALNQITNHRNQFVKAFTLRRHFRLVTGCDERVIVPLDLKDEFFLHAASLAHQTDFDKARNRECAAQGREGEMLRRRRGNLLSFARVAAILPGIKFVKIRAICVKTGNL
jgi:hypothetical protein